MDTLYEVLLPPIETSVSDTDVIGSVYMPHGATAAQIHDAAQDRFGNRAQAFRRSTGGRDNDWNYFPFCTCPGRNGFNPSCDAHGFNTQAKEA